ncbi:MAG: GNAT family N-acetyltransferase, partial [Gemmatimonadetes bacterium]|nr:GNAT family N-acetyltransferase [Gemmatimonadota bacterium]
ARMYRARELSPDLINSWDHLESRSLEPNPFLSPWFVLPALEHLPEEGENDPIVIGVGSGDDDELLGLGIFEPSLGSRLLPLPHLRSWKSAHSFLDGVLLDRDRPLEAATAIFEWMQGTRNRWHGLSFQDRSDDTESSLVLEEAASRFGIPWTEDWQNERAFAMGSLLPEDCIGELFHGKRRREMRRRIRRLQSFGAVDFTVKNPMGGNSEPLESFLAMEAMGWKGEEQSALRCHAGRERFAREMVAGLSKVGKTVFGQLTVGDQLAATDLYLRSGDSLFSFKSGWHPRFGKGSPGVVLKLRWMEAVRDFPELESVDSCAASGSWIEPIWPSRRRLTTGVFPTSHIAQQLTEAALKMKRFKRRISAARSRTDPAVAWRLLVGDHLHRSV